jgi:hypothetical protein
LIIFSLQVRLPRSSARFLFGAVLLIFSIRLFMVGRTWHTLSNRIARQVELFQALPEGAMLYPLFVPSHTNREDTKMELALEHVAEYAVIVRQAFVPTQLAVPGQETVLFRVPLPYKDTTSEPRVWITSMQKYDFVWSHGISADVERALEQNCDQIIERDGFSIWRVRK